MRQTNENAEIMIISIRIVVYNRNRLAIKNTMPE